MLATQLNELRKIYMGYKLNLSTSLTDLLSKSSLKDDYDDKQLASLADYANFRLLPAETRMAITGSADSTSVTFLNLEQILPVLAIFTDPGLLTYILDSSSDHYGRLVDRLGHPVSINKALLLNIDNFMETLNPKE